MSEKKTVVVASNNAHKIEEIRAILSAVLSDAEFKAMGEIGGLPEPEETGTTFEENAFIKAQTIHDLTGLPTVADDSGLVVDALDGRRVSIRPAIAACTGTTPPTTRSCCARWRACRRRSARPAL